MVNNEASARRGRVLLYVDLQCFSLFKWITQDASVVNKLENELYVTQCSR
jgi:hypothetical protein